MQHAIKLLAITLALGPACATAAADPADTGPRQAARADACKPTGKVVFEIAHKIEPGAKLSTSTVKLYATGAWTRDEVDADGKAQPQAGGCVAKPDYQPLADALHAAPWKITTAKVHCMAMSSNFTEFHVDGRRVFTQKLCSGQALDDKSRAALERAVAQLEPPAGAGKTP
jgi:hypothetical protein